MAFFCVMQWRAPPPSARESLDAEVPSDAGTLGNNANRRAVPGGSDVLAKGSSKRSEDRTNLVRRRPDSRQAFLVLLMASMTVSRWPRVAHRSANNPRRSSWRSYFARLRKTEIKDKTRKKKRSAKSTLVNPPPISKKLVEVPRDFFFFFFCDLCYTALPSKIGGGDRRCVGFPTIFLVARLGMRPERWMVEGVSGKCAWAIKLLRVCSCSVQLLHVRCRRGGSSDILFELPSSRALLHIHEVFHAFVSRWPLP